MNIALGWLGLTAISVVFRAIYGVMTKVLSNKSSVSAYTQSVLLLVAGGVISLLVSPLLGGISTNISSLNLLAVSLVVIPSAIGNFLYFIAIKDLTNGTAQIAFSSILIFATSLSVVFLGLKLSPMNLLGVILLMIAILSVVNGKVELDRRGVTIMVASALMFAVFQLASAHVSKEVNAATYLMIGYFGPALVLFALKPRKVIQEIRSSDLKRTFTIPLLTAIPSVGNFLFAYYAYRIAPEPAKVAMLLSAQVVVTVLLSYFFLNEKGHVWRKVGAAVLVVIAAVLIKL
jgi:drug/metabolite transporter (DMT)-like permease